LRKTEYTKRGGSAVGASPLPPAEKKKGKKYRPALQMPNGKGTVCEGGKKVLGSYSSCPWGREGREDRASPSIEVRGGSKKQVKKRRRKIDSLQCP